MIGDIIKALNSGQYDHKNIAIGITQTGGQCRASSYLSLIKKALLSAGYSDIPVISCTLADGLNDQPGFEINWLRLLKILFCGTLFADILAKMYYATVVREKVKGESKRLQNQYLERVKEFIAEKDYNGLFKLMEKAVRDFNRIAVFPGTYPKIGIVGEIYAKYNAFAHQHIIDWLISRGIEVVVPPIIDFFKQDFVNVSHNSNAFLRKRKPTDILIRFLDTYTQGLQRRADKILQQFRFAAPFHNLKQKSQSAQRILDLSNQFGEGWLIAAEVSSFAEEGINNVVSVQPFGCIANHVISKGVEKRLKQFYPEMNLLFLDFEAGTSEVNILNRLYFLIKNMKTNKGVA